MNNERAIEILEMLLNGIDPVTGEILPEKGTHAEPEVIRALYKGIQALSREAKQEKTESIIKKHRIPANIRFMVKTPS